MVNGTANYRVISNRSEYMVIEDLGPHDLYQTITNAAEWVVDQLADRLGDRELYYIDTDGTIDQLVIESGKFKSFKSGGPEGRTRRMDKQLIVDGKIAGTLCESSIMGGGEMYFGVTVSPLRAEYLAKCLDEPLCKHCGREEAECEADPCGHAQIEADTGIVEPAEYRGNDYGDDDEPDKQSLYVAAGGCRCPECGSTNIDGEGVEIDIGTASQEVGCNTCQAEWYDRYALTGYSSIEEGDQCSNKP